MKKNGWTQMRLASFVGCSQTTVSQALRGDVEFSVLVGIRLSDLTGLPLEDICTSPTVQKVLQSYIKRVGAGHEIPKDPRDVA
jgi:DNA-binding XRE family transcriptional regulator